MDPPPLPKVIKKNHIWDKTLFRSFYIPAIIIFLSQHWIINSFTCPSLTGICNHYRMNNFLLYLYRSSQCNFITPNESNNNNNSLNWLEFFKRRSILENTLLSSTNRAVFLNTLSGEKYFLKRFWPRGFDARSRCTNASWHSLNVREKGKEEDVYVCKRKEKKGNSKKRYFEVSRDVHRNPSGARFLSPSIAPLFLLFSRWLSSATVFREGLWFGTGWKREKEITWRQLETTFRCRTSPRAERRRGCRMTLLGSSVIQMRSLQVS